jgi:hypothetical protein
MFPAAIRSALIALASTALTVLLTATATSLHLGLVAGSLSA